MTPAPHSAGPLLATALLAVLFPAAAPAQALRPGLDAPAAPMPTLTGQDAFGDWRTDAPGVRRLITPRDLPAPLATASTSNSSRTAPRPPGLQPVAPEGFSVEPFATGLSGPRVVRVAPDGDVFVAETRTGRILAMRDAGRGAAPATPTVFASGLDGPFGIAFYPPGPSPRWVYVANQTNVMRYPYKAGELKPAGAPETLVRGLPAGGHTTRDIAFSRDGKTMFISVGSASNVPASLPRMSDAELAHWQIENGLGAAWGPERWRADVLAFDAEGRGIRAYATGLRNCAGVATEPKAGTLWCVVNERDALGDNLPPDYATSVKSGAFYGWPWYYIGRNEDPRLKGQRPDLAAKVTVPDILFQPHSAPLAIAFYDGEQFPSDYRGSAFVTLHGSWNRAKRTGYKVVRLIFANGKPTGEYEDFLTGFVVNDQAVWGRPVGVAVARNGALLVSEDEAGTMWRVSWTGQ